MRNRRVVDPSALGSTKRLELIIIKVGAVIYDNVVRNSISEYQLLDETDSGACTKVLDGSSCWKYALEAIIKGLLLYFFVHDSCLLFML